MKIYRFQVKSGVNKIRNRTRCPITKKRRFSAAYTRDATSVHCADIKSARRSIMNFTYKGFGLGFIKLIRIISAD